MRKLLLFLFVALLSLPMSGQNLKGQNHLTEGENEYRFFVKIRPEAVIDIDANKVLSFSKLRNSELDEVLGKLNEYDFVQIIDFDKNERNLLRSGQKVRSTNNNFNKTEFSGLLQMQGSQNMDKYELLALAEELEKYDIVEYCDISPVTPTPPPGGAAARSETSALSEDIITPDFEGRQSYLFGYKEKDIHGIYVDYAWSLGITGQGVTIADIEPSWTYTHEDFIGQNVIDGLSATNHDYDSHGTAVMGQMYAARNGYGVTGGVYGADAFYGFSESPLGREKAIAKAMEVLQPGDVMIYEMQRGGAGTDGYVPADYTKTIWDLTKSATESGIIVVAAAGNGGVNLDGSAYDAYRNRGDNGSILVSSATMNGRKRYTSILGPSTYGSMIKLCGIGDESIVSTGYKDLFYNGGNAGYTSVFSATSAATPVVAAAAAAIQSYAKNKLDRTILPLEMRDLLYETGTPATGEWGSSVIPRLPNVKDAIKKIDPDVLENKYTLTINNGIGSGFYAPGEKVAIKAGYVHNDSVLSHWEFIQGSAVIEEVAGNSSKLTMPAADVIVMPRYKLQNQCHLTFSRNTYAVGEQITINFKTNTPIDSEIKFFLVSEQGDKISLGKKQADEKQLVMTIPMSIIPDISYFILSEFTEGGERVQNMSKSFRIASPESDVYVIPRTDMSIFSASSEEFGKATNAIDGNPETVWQSAEGYPHEIVIKLNAPREMTGLFYLPVQSGNTGMIGGHEIYISTDGKEWGTAVASGNWPPMYSEQKVTFSKVVEGQYIKIKALGNMFMSPYAAISEVLIQAKRDVKIPAGNIALSRSYYKPGEEVTVRLSSNIAQQVNVYLVGNGIEKNLGTTTVGAAVKEFITSIPTDCNPGENYRIAVEFTESDNFRRFSSSIEIKNYDQKYQVVPRTSLTVHSFDSEQNQSTDAAANAIDGDENTYWHTSWSSSVKHPHHIVLKIDSVYELTGLIYVPRQSGTNGHIAQYEIYTSIDGTSWPDTPAASGTWSSGNAEKTVLFEDVVKSRYVKLVALSEVAGQAFTSVGELLLLHTSPSTGIEQIIKDDVVIYPNPAKDFIYIKGVAENEIIQIISSSGVLMSEIKIKGDGQINISNLPQGVYLIKAGNVVKRLIKQ